MDFQDYLMCNRRFRGCTVTQSDLARIEDAVKISLPDDYRRTMLGDDLPEALADALWGDAKLIIKENLSFRADGFFCAPGEKNWPDHYLAIGNDCGYSYYFLDMGLFFRNWK